MITLPAGESPAWRIIARAIAAAELGRYFFSGPTSNGWLLGSVEPQLLPGVSEVKRCRVATCSGVEADDDIEFVTIMPWDSVDAIRAVVGADYETAVIPEDRRKYLSHYYWLQLVIAALAVVIS